MKRPDKRPDTWMPLYVGDYLRDTGHLSAAEHGAYLLLIMQAWTRGGSLPTAVERLRLMCRIDPAEWEAVKDAVLPFFYIKDGCYRHKRVDRELNGATFNIEQRRTAGKASAEARKRQREATEASTDGQRPFNENGNGTVNETSTEVPTEPPTEGQRNGRPSPSPSSISKKETSLRDAKKVTGQPVTDPDFEQFWAAYPRKDDKGHARKAWPGAIRKVAAETILSSVRSYQFNEDPKFIPLAATWLNGERWGDVGSLLQENRPYRPTPMSGAL